MQPLILTFSLNSEVGLSYYITISVKSFLFQSFMFPYSTQSKLEVCDVTENVLSLFY